jgi:hypothetical protein
MQEYRDSNSAAAGTKKLRSLQIPFEGPCFTAFAPKKKTYSTSGI